MSVKISNLPAATQANLTDLFVKSDQGGAPSQKLTVQQLITLIQTAMTQLSVAAGSTIMDGTGTLTVGFGSAPGPFDGTIKLLSAGNSSMITLLGTDGSGHFRGDIEISNTAFGLILNTPGGFRYRLKMDDNGQLGTEGPL